MNQFYADVLLAIDPGNKESGYIIWDVVNERPASVLPEGVESMGIIPNSELLSICSTFRPSHLSIEKIQCYGMAVGESIFETVFWTGRFYQECKAPSRMRAPRRDIKIHICGQARAKDPNIRQALIDRYGPTGTKKNKGTLYGVKSHIWAALAVAVYTTDVLINNNAQEGTYDG